MKNVIIGNILNVSTGKIENDQAIIIEKGKIVDIIKKDQLKNDSDPKEVIDYNDKFIIPGLIDSHVHLIFSASSNPLQDFMNSSKEQLYELALKNTQLALEAGITTVRDCGSISDITFKLRENINSGAISGARVITSGEAITTKKGHIYFIGEEANTSEEMKKAAEKLIEKGADFIKLIISGGNMTPGSKDTVDQYTRQQIMEITNFVHSKGKKIMAHIHTKEGMEKAIEAGVDYIEHGSWRIEDGIDVDDNLIKKMHEENIIYCTALPKTYLVKFEETHKNRVFTTIKNMRYKENVLLGTDGGTTNNSIKELINQSVYLQEKGNFTNNDLLQMMTLNPGREILEGNLGEIAIGKIADLAILDGNPLERLEYLKNVVAVYKEGKKLFKRI